MAKIAQPVFEAYYTPEWLAKDMINLANIGRDDRVLEPSAGQGALATIAQSFTNELITCFELNKDCSEILNTSGFLTKRCDFLQQSPTPVFDIVLMNPPTKGYVDHIFHAFKFLKSGGRLVALVVSEFLTGDGEKAEELCTLIQSASGRVYQVAYPVFTLKANKIDSCIVMIERW